MDLTSLLYWACDVVAVYIIKTKIYPIFNLNQMKNEEKVCLSYIFSTILMQFLPYVDDFISLSISNDLSFFSIKIFLNIDLNLRSHVNILAELMC